MRMIAPLSRLAIWAKAIISMRSDAERTAIFPVPPIELLIMPDPMQSRLVQSNQFSDQSRCKPHS